MLRIVSHTHTHNIYTHIYLVCLCVCVCVNSRWYMAYIAIIITVGIASQMPKTCELRAIWQHAAAQPRAWQATKLSLAS